jgi:hypothetical protein
VLRFVPERPRSRRGDRAGGSDLDEIPFAGTTFDLGEAVAQSLALAIDPFATGPEADRVAQGKGPERRSASGPFAALAALKKD